MLVPCPSLWFNMGFRKWEVPRGVATRLAQTHLQPSHRKPLTYLRRQGLSSALMTGVTQTLSYLHRKRRGCASFARVAWSAGPLEGNWEWDKARGNLFLRALGGSILCGQGGLTAVGEREWAVWVGELGLQSSERVDRMSQVQWKRRFHDKEGGSLSQAGGNNLAVTQIPLQALHKGPFSNSRRISC